MAQRKWTREKVIEAIRRRQRQGLAMKLVWRDDGSLYGAAKKHFGSWQGALLAVGVPGARAFRRWPKQRVIDAIRARRAQGLSLSRTWKEDRILYDAAHRRFTTWRRALVAAGIKPLRAASRRWTREAVLDAIRDRHRQGLPLIGIAKHDPALGTAGLRLFGGWRKAMRAAGIPVKERMSWTRERVIDGIQSRHRRGLRITNVSKKDAALATAAYKYFGSWEKALLAAGLEPNRRRKWTPERVIQEVQNWYRHGTPKASVWEKDCGLGGAAARYFGGWREAMKAAGIRPTQRIWSPDLVIEALRAWRRGPCKGALSTEDKGLAAAAKKYFGSYDKAFAAAGLDPPQRGWSKQQVIEAIQDRHVKGLPLQGRKAGLDPKLVASATSRFGSWRQALLAAGFDVGARRPRTKWTRNRVIAQIRHWHERGLPLTRLWRENPTLATAVARYFGSRQKALAAAGIARKGNHP